jgi:hypothetical protein
VQLPSPQPVGLWLRPYLSEVLAVTDSGKCSGHSHDGALATDRQRHRSVNGVAAAGQWQWLSDASWVLLLGPLHFWLTNRKNIPTAINIAIRIPTMIETTQCRRSMGFVPAPLCAAPMPNQKRRLPIERYLAQNPTLLPSIIRHDVVGGVVWTSKLDGSDAGCPRRKRRGCWRSSTAEEHCD